MNSFSNLTQFTNNLELIMSRLILFVIIGAILVNSATAAEISANSLFKLLTTTEVDTRPQLIQAIEEVSKNGVTKKAKAHIAAGGAQHLYTWINNEQVKEFEKAIKETAKRVAALNPTNSSDRAELEHTQGVVTDVHDAVRDIEKVLHSHSEKLIVFFAIKERTSASSYAVFMYQTLPRLRRSLSRIDTSISLKLNKPAPKKSSLETVNDAKSMSSVAWAWKQHKRFSEFWKNKNANHHAEAEQLDVWAKAVLDILPKDKNKLESETYGAYQALRNVLDNYKTNIPSP